MRNHDFRGVREMDFEVIVASDKIGNEATLAEKDGNVYVVNKLASPKRKETVQIPERIKLEIDKGVIGDMVNGSRKQEP